MQRLRQQVDRIDLKLLNLLQQRTKLSAEIGRAKRRHGAEIYVPQREREVLARVSVRTRGTLPPPAAAAIFREILSSSRAAQGQAPIGLLAASSPRIVPTPRWPFGACDRLEKRSGWDMLASDLVTGKLVLALLTSADLAAILRRPPTRADFLARFVVAGDFSAASDAAPAEIVFIVTARAPSPAVAGTRALILIECKNTAYAIKSLLTAMPQRPKTVETIDLPTAAGRPDAARRLLRIGFAHEVAATAVATPGLTALNPALLGVYSADEAYGG